jgi:uncharacterized protein (TIGR03435 family)
MLGRVCVVGLLACGMAVGQAPAGAKPAGAKGTALAFDVVSIKPSGTPPSGFGLGPSGYSAKGWNLYTTIMLAYYPMTTMFGYSTDRMSGEPPWVRNDRYDIDAKLDEESVLVWKNLTVEQRWEKLRPLLLAILQERCKLVTHTTMVDAPVYELVVGKHGLKMKETPSDEAPPEHAIPISDEAWMIPIQPGAVKPQFVYFRTSMADLAKDLSTVSNRPVVDRTGLTGKYDFAVPRIDPIPSTVAGNGAASDPDESPKWDVTEAGLEMRPAKAPEEFLVIDHIEKPTAN